VGQLVKLFAMSAACTRAQMLSKTGDANAIDLADLFCRESRLRIRAHFDNLFGVNDAAIYRVSQQVLRGEFEWLERGIIDAPEPAPSGMAMDEEPLAKPEPAVVG